MSRCPAGLTLPLTPLRNMHHLTTRNPQVAENHTWFRPLLAFLSSQHQQLQNAPKVRIRLKQADGDTALNSANVCLVASLRIDEVFAQESNNRCHCACEAAAGGERPALRVSLFETDTGELLFSGLTPKSAVDGQTTQLSALIGAQWGRSQRGLSPCQSLSGRKCISRAFVKYSVSFSLTIRGRVPETTPRL